nr:hypothetical protein [Tanacetum cinerariifolium]
MCTDFILFTDIAPLPPRDQRHPWLRYQVEGYIEDIMHKYEQRPETIFGRSVNWVYVLDFAGLTMEMKQTLAGRLRMVYLGMRGRSCILAMHQGDYLRSGTGDLRDYWVEISSDRDFLGPALSYVFIQDPVRRLLYLTVFLADGRHLRRHAEGRKSGARLSGDTLLGVLLSTLALLNICERIGDAWVWVAPGLERQPDVTTDAPEAAEDAPAVDEDAQVDPAPVQPPQPLHAAPGLCHKGLRGSRRRCTSYDGAL